MAWSDSFLGNEHQVKIWQAYTVTSITDCWPCFTVHADCTLHMLLLASRNLLLSRDRRPSQWWLHNHV